LGFIDNFNNNFTDLNSEEFVKNTKNINEALGRIKGISR
jgi:hypothetical protein